VANTDTVNGFKPVGSLTGGPWTGAGVRKCTIQSGVAVAVAVGDIVKLAANTGGDIFPCVVNAAAGNVPYGVVVHIPFDPDNLGRKHHAASVVGLCYVDTDPNTIMEVQNNGSFEDGDIGANGDLVDAGVDTATGNSGMEINTSTLANTSTLVFHCLGLVDRPDNALGTNAKCLVCYNIHQFRATGVTAVHGA